MEIIAPSFHNAEFAVEDDRPVVRRLLVDALVRALPVRKKYVPYVGEWQGEPWSPTEVDAMLDGSVVPRRIREAGRVVLFEPDIPRDLRVVSERQYVIQRSQTWDPYWIWGELGGALEGVGKAMRVAVFGFVVGSALAVAGALSSSVMLIVVKPTGWRRWACATVLAVCAPVSVGSAWATISLLGSGTSPAVSSSTDVEEDGDAQE